MQNLIRIPLLVLALLLSAALTAAEAKPAAPPPDYFPLRVGDWWKYRFTSSGKSSEFTVKVAEVEGKGADALYVVETTTATQVIREWYSHPTGWILVHRIAYPKNPDLKAAYAPVRKLLENPLVVGHTWSWSGKGMMDVDIQDDATVGAAEKVTVTAGTFAAMRVDSKVKQGGAEVEKHYWYADHIGLVRSTTKSGDIESINELVDYSFKPKR